MIEAGSITSLLFSVLALSLVLALAWLLLKGLAAMSRRGSSRAPMSIKASLPLGSRERLIIVEYREFDYLLGVSSGNISLIDKHPVSSSTKAYPAQSPSTRLDNKDT